MTLTLPSELPKQETSDEVALAESDVGWVIVTVVISSHPLESVTVT